MIEVPALVTSVLASAGIVLDVKVSAWIGGALLASDVPIVAADEEGVRADRIPERVTLTVPRYDRGTAWAPGSDPDHPLASNGQRLNVKLGVGTTNGLVEYFDRGWFLVQSADQQGDTVNVTAVGLLALVDEARLVAPLQPSGTLGSTLRALIEPGLTVDLTDAPADRAVPAGINYDEDRLGAALELVDAWAADLAVNEGGFLTVEPSATPTAALATISDSGASATVVRVTGSTTREHGFNVVVARGTAPDGGQVQGLAYDTTSPRRYGGSWSPYPVPYFFPSPLLTTVTQCEEAARTVLRRLQREAGAELTVEMVPNPTLQLGDAVLLESDAFTGLCTIERLQLPYRVESGDHRMTLTLREVL